LPQVLHGLRTAATLTRCVRDKCLPSPPCSSVIVRSTTPAAFRRLV
jgi:hypothetical protein